MFTMKQLTVLFIIGLCIADTLASCVVQTKLGLVKGTKLKSRSGKVFQAFNIPYAEAPVGKLRFQNPQPKKPWDHVLHGEKQRCECVQINKGVISGCEDCLHLNVYTPEVQAEKLYPVMAYIHGSEYLIGNNSIEFAGPGFLLDKPVVYVIFNYRLNILGFLSTGDDAASGNYGVKDQALALEWIKDNIRSFGGNPEEVTLFAHGAGSECGNLHVLSSKSQHLFKRVILQSGTALNPGVLSSGPSYHDKGKKVAELLKCPTTDSHKMVDCLRNVSANEIIKVSLDVFDDIDKAAHRTWRATQEPKVPGAFITDTPEDLIQMNQWKRSPLIIGVTQDEGTFFSENMLTVTNVYEQCRNDPVGVIERFLHYYTPLDGMNVTEIAIKAKNFYIGKETPKSKEDLVEKFTNLATDFFYVFPTLQINKYLQSIEPNRSYTYVFDYHGTITPTLTFPGQLGKTGVGHGAEVYSEFPLSGALIGPEYGSLKRSEKDYKVVDIFIDLWTTFANNSVPTSSTLKNPHMWQPQRNTSNHLKIGNGVDIDVTVEEKYSSRVNFWFENVPEYCFE